MELHTNPPTVNADELLPDNPSTQEECDLLVCKYEAMVNNLNLENHIDVLVVRDHIQILLTEQLLLHEQILRINNSDLLLRAGAQSLGVPGDTKRDLFQQTILPPNNHWWWQPSEGHFLWNVVSLIALAITGALATQFTASILSKNPDAWGFLAVVLQGALTLLAGGTFTSAGKNLYKKIGLGRMTVESRAALATALAILVFLLWNFGPSALASHYNSKGLQVCPSNLSCTDLEKAITMFERASSLDPDNSRVHYNFGRAYELAFDYDKAVEQYKEAVRDAPDSPAALSNWARLLVIQKKDITLALSLLDDAARKADNRAKQGDQPKPYFAAPGIYKNRGLANYQAGYYLLAEADLKHALDLQKQLDPDIDIASPHCLLTMTYVKLGKDSDANQEATKCLQIYDTELSRAVGLSPKVDADSIRFAHNILHKAF